MTTATSTAVVRDRGMVIAGGVSFIVGALAFVLVFGYLAANFDYPDILAFSRPATILSRRARARSFAVSSTGAVDTALLEFSRSLAFATIVGVSDTVEVQARYVLHVVANDGADFLIDFASVSAAGGTSIPKVWSPSGANRCWRGRYCAGGRPAIATIRSSRDSGRTAPRDPPFRPTSAACTSRPRSAGTPSIAARSARFARSGRFR